MKTDVTRADAASAARAISAAAMRRRERETILVGKQRSIGASDEVVKGKMPRVSGPRDNEIS